MQIKLSSPTLEIRDRAIPPEVIRQAREWPVFLELESSPTHPRLQGAYLRCGTCTQGVKRIGAGLAAELSPWPFSVQELEAAVLGHVLQAHRPEVDPGWSGS